MRRAAISLGSTLALALAWLAACGGRSPFIDRDFVESAGGSGGQSIGGEGGAGGLAGGGGFEAGSGPGGSGTGGGGIDPIGCLTCVATECPDVLACLTNPACLQGTVCAVQSCLSGGQPDFFCVLECFNGDTSLALQAVQSLACVFGTCGDVCGGGFPLPGGGGLPGGG